MVEEEGEVGQLPPRQVVEEVVVEPQLQVELVQPQVALEDNLELQLH
jgi:hypothetical protein